MRLEAALPIFSPGAIITTGAASASVAIPNLSSGNRPNFIRVGATQAAYVRVGTGAQTAAAGDLLVQPADAIILAVGPGTTTIAAIQVTTAGIVQVSPIETI